MTIEPLPDEITAAHAVILKQQQRIVCLEREVTFLKEKFDLLQQQVFGRSSEKRSSSDPQPDQLVLGIVSQNPPEQDNALETQAGAGQKITYERKKAVATRIPTGERFPAELPRVDKVINPDKRPGVEYDFVRNDITERLGSNEVEFHVVRVIRPILKEREGQKLVQAPSDALFDRCAVEPSFIAKMLESKFCWFLPLYRQELMLKSNGILMSRDSLIDYTIRSGALLAPIAKVIHQEILDGRNLHIDETPLLVGKTSGHSKHYKQSFLWPISSDEEVSFKYAAGRGKVELKKILPGFQGTLHSDGYAAYKSFCRAQGITQVCCMGHARREFVKAEKSDPNRVNAIIATIKLLYEIEEQIKTEPPAERLRRRQIDALPLLKKLKTQVHEIKNDPRVLPKSQLLKACHYFTSRWQELTVYASDGTLDIDNLSIERQIRYVALGRKNWLFCASEVGAETVAALYTIINSCRMANVSVFDYLSDVLVRVQTHPKSQLRDLMPKIWKIKFLPEILAEKQLRRAQCSQNQQAQAVAA